MTKDTKEMEYVIKIQSKIAELFNEDNDSGDYIDPSELENEENLTHFIHAMCNMAPTNLYNKLTGSDENILTFNHIANRLCFQYAKKDK